MLGWARPSGLLVSLGGSPGGARLAKLLGLVSAAWATSLVRLLAAELPELCGLPAWAVPARPPEVLAYCTPPGGARFVRLLVYLGWLRPFHSQRPCLPF